eukprot:4832145-Lingulodinium_polyedra.AAC.1
MALVAPTLLRGRALHLLPLVGCGHGTWPALSALRKVDRNCRPRLGDADQEIWIRANYACHDMRPK